MSQVSQAIIAAVPATSKESAIKAARRENLEFFWEPNHHGMWSSPNASYLPLPIHEPSTDGDHGTVRDYFHAPRKIRWLQALQPFLAFWPRYPEWTGVFSCLNLVRGRVPVTRSSNSRWTLDGYLVTAMRVLESNLVNLGTKLLRRNLTFKYEWSEIRVSSLPYQSGYEGVYRTQEQAVAAAYTSRNAFVILSAFVSYAIALDIALQSVPGEAVSSWFKYAETVLGMDNIWLNGLKNSFVCNFKRGFRPGAYVSSKLPTYTQTFAAFKVANVPLYICWGLKPAWFRGDDPVLRYRPCQAEAQRAIHIYAARESQPQPPSPAPIIPLPAPGADDMVTSSLREPVSSADETAEENPYKHGPQVHFARLKEERAEAIKRETGDGARCRKQIEQSAELDKLDTLSTEPKTGILIYVWTELGDDVFTRREIHPNEWKDVWVQYKPEERHFSMDYSEWNLFRPGDDLFQEDERFPDDPLTNFHSTTEDELPENNCEVQGKYASREDEVVAFWKNKYSQNHTDEDTDDDQSDYGSKDGEVLDTRKRTWTAVGPRKRSGPQDNRTVPHLEQGFAQTQTSDYSSLFSPDDVDMLDAVATLRVKYRYLLSLPYNPHPQMESVLRPAQGLQPSLVDEKNSLKRIGVETATIPETPAMDDDTRRQEIRAGIVDFFNYSIMVNKVFSPLWDLAPARRNDIVNHPYFAYLRRDSKCHIIGVRGPLALMDQWYLLVVYDARVIVELFSTPKSSIGELVRYLIQNGIPFATGKPVQNKPRYLPRPGIHRLNYHQSVRQFTLDDYQDYQRRKETILSGAAGRAAIARGGIVWRLSVAHVPPSRLTHGPSSTVIWEGVTVANGEGGFLVDDDITTDELDIICGTYRVYTNYGNQTEDKSWFPKASVWESSGFDQGYWTADNESWYQDRLQEIANGGGMKNSNEWRKYLRRGVRSGLRHNFTQSVDDVFDRFLKGDTSYWMG